MPITHFKEVFRNLWPAGQATRRQLLQSGGLLAAAGLIRPFPAEAQLGASAPGGNIYASVGVRPMINARGTVTIVGATRMLPEVKKAMELASHHYVQLDELADGVGRKLADLTGAEWGCVTAGCAAALMLATAGCVTGADPDKMAQLPDLRGLKDEVIMPRYSRVVYDHSVRAIGVRVIEVTTREELEAAMGPRTAMVFVVAGVGSERGPLSLSVISSIAKPKGVPILVDAAAEELAIPNVHLQQGADLVAYSGGKCLRGPQCAGLLLGRKGLVQAAWTCGAPHHGVARGVKVGREEMLGMVTAVEMWKKRDHEAETKQWRGWLEIIARQVDKAEGVKTQMEEPRGRSNRTPSLTVSWDTSRIPLTGYEVESLLYEGEPRIAVGGAGSFLPFPPNMTPTINIVPYQMEEGEVRVVADRVYALLSKPPRKQPLSAAPVVDLSGEWDVQLSFVAGNSTHKFVFQQKGNELAGTHHGTFADRDLSGTIYGKDVLLRSSYTEHGTRLNFTFTGAVEGDRIQGDVSLGEYGTATWVATRHAYGRGGRRRPSA